MWRFAPARPTTRGALGSEGYQMKDRLVGQICVFPSASVTRITDRFDTIYSIDGDPHAVPPPADRPLIGR